MVSHSVTNQESSVVLDVVLRLLSTLTLSTDDAHNLIQVIIDSTDPANSSSSTSSATTFLTAQTQPTSSSTLVSVPPTEQTPPPIPSATPTLLLPPSTIRTEQTVPPIPSATLAPPPPPSTTPTQSPAPSQNTQTLPDLPITSIMVNGEERFQHHYEGFAFDVPHTAADGPFYLVTRGRRVGVFSSWSHTSPHVIGVSHSTYTRARSRNDALIRMLDAINLEEAEWLT
ncbi:hypothetical protein BD769DRAFT_1672262 [Suillus cothurnatus]|nr:hypothetical protein BD769DRAFT_1672262 [Suillus cothurnatus]